MPVEYRSYPMSSDGDVVGSVVTFLDITDRRRILRAQQAQQRMAAMRAEVADLLARFEQVDDAFERSLRAIVSSTRAAGCEIWTGTTEGQSTPSDASEQSGVTSSMMEPLRHAGLTSDTAAGARVPHDVMAAHLQVGENRHDDAIADFPLKVEGQPVGLLRVYSARNLPRRETRAIREVSDQLAQFIARRRVLAALTESERQFRQLADSIPQLAWMARPDGFIFWYNQRWFDFTGTTLEQMQGWGWQDVHDPQELPRVLESIKHSFATGEPWEEVFPLRRRDGVFRWHLSRMMPIRDHEGRIVRWFGTNTDVTEQRESEAALRESERRFRQLAEAMPQIVWVADREGSLEYFNQQWYEFTGCEATEDKDQSWLDRLHADDREAVWLGWREAVAKVQPFEVEYRLRSSVGDYRWFLRRAVPISDDAGAVTRWFGTSTDIHDRKQAQEDLAASQQFLRSSIDALSSRIAVLDESGEVLSVNDAWTSFAQTLDGDAEGFGVGENYLLACRQAEGASGPELQAIAEGIARVVDGAEGAFMHEYCTSFGSEARWFQVRITRFQTGMQRRVVVAHEEVTQRVLSENATKLRSEQLRKLTEVAVLAATLDTPGEILDAVTGAACDVVGAEHAESRWIASVDEGRETLARASAGASQFQAIDEELFALTCAANRPQRKVCVDQRAACLAAPLVGFNGKNIGAVQLRARAGEAFTDDDEMLVVQLAQVASAGVENIRLYDEVKASDERKDHFLAVLGHELRNPLAPLSAALYLMLHDQQDVSHRREHIEMATRQCEQLKRLIDDLLDISRIATGKLRLEKEELDLCEAARAAYDTALPAMEAAGHQFVANIPSDPVWVFGDRVRLTQATANVLLNAAKYTPNGGRVELRVERVGKDVRISVEDNGIGIPRERLNEVFELFAQVDSSTTRSQGGLGIGLTLVKTLVELHEGRIQLASEGAGKGSRFTIEIPRLTADQTPASTQAHSKMTVGNEQSDASPLPRLRVAVVDDNRAAALMTRRILEKFGQQVVVYNDANSALEAIVADPPDLVISDVAMPGMSGHDLAAAIRKRLSKDRPSLVAVTGYGQEKDRREALEAGFDRHLVKPVGVEELTDAVRYAGARSPAVD
ncbi:MAG: PAS domain S-box protein, partial [Planctomycetales bacterium]|nr:PAS domain S-box protein [Planctomycetales bacterium]